MEWNKTQIGQWHRQAMPGCKVEEQRKKAALEAEELFAALKGWNEAEKLEKWADVYIANAALKARYHDAGAQLMIKLIEKMKQWPKIEAAVDCKMWVNVERKFAKIDGQWRHIEK